MKDQQQLRNVYQDKRVLVTGGLGFIGSNLVLTLARLGASVVAVDSLVAGCGGALHNLDGAEGDISVVVSDIGAGDALDGHIRSADVIFNLAGEIAHLPSTRHADRDLTLNVSAQLAFLDQCARLNPGVRVVYTCTRQVYGVPRYLPVDEGHPAQPVDFNGVHKLAAAHYHLLLWNMQQLDAVVLYLTNVYGPRMALHLPQQGVFANFLRQAVAGQPITVYGEGDQRRDPLYVDDAVEAILRAGALPLGSNRSFNIGHPETWSIHEIAAHLSALANLPEPQRCPFPPERLRIDVGHYATDTRLAESVLGFRARTSVPEGLTESLRFFGCSVPSVLPIREKSSQGQVA